MLQVSTAHIMKITVLLLFGVLLAGILNWQFPVLRFTSHWANETVALLMSVIPLVLIGAGIIQLGTYCNRWVAMPLTLGSLLLSLPVLAVVAFKAFTLPPLANEDDASFAKIEQIDPQVAVYRTNGGATTAYGIVVRQEQGLVPGVVLVKQLFSKYGISYINYTKVGDQLTIIDPSSTLETHEVCLKRFVYF
jgi:hypothetical protein